jgi:uncharacterized metal-binding protein YceD (DUF177 family)
LAVEKLSSYLIAFKGLKEGNHVFDYHIGNSFFELFENSLIEAAEAEAKVVLEKRNTFMSLELSLRGTVRLTCDRCLEEYDQPVENSARLIIKFGETEQEDGDEVIWLHPDDYQFNVAQIIYEYLVFSIPLKHVHPSPPGGPGGCNPEMLKKLKEYTPLHGEKGDDRWEKLKNLLNNN